MNWNYCFRINNEATRIEFDAYFSNISFNALYEGFAGSYIYISKYGNGQNELKGEITNLKVNIVLQGEYNRENFGHFRAYKVDVRLSSRQSAKINTQLINKPNTYYHLSLFMSRYLKNSSSEVLLTIGKVAAKVIMRIANKIFRNFPVKMLMILVDWTVVFILSL